MVMGDWNQAIRTEKIQDWKDRLSLKNKMMEKSKEHTVLPGTYQRGRLPIYSIIPSSVVEIDKAEYLAFGEGVGDHRALFSDVKIASVLGVNLPPIQSERSRRLKM